MGTSVAVILVGAGVCLAVVLAAVLWLVLSVRREARRIEREYREDQEE